MLDDGEFARLQRHLAAQPDAGDVIPGSDGCRKLRWALSGGGKRGGARVNYFQRPNSGDGALVTMYAKNERDNIDPGLLRELRRQYEKTSGT